MKKLLAAAVAISGLTFGCGVGGGSGSSTANSEQALCTSELGLTGPNSTGEVPDGCVRIEGGEIGQLPLTIELDGVDVQITAWIGKDDAADEYIGFEYTSTDDIVYTVKTGDGSYVGQDSRWTHPDGSNANAISNITFCPYGGTYAEDGGTTVRTPGGPCVEPAGSGGGGSEFDESGRTPGGGNESGGGGTGGDQPIE